MEIRIMMKIVFLALPLLAASCSTEPLVKRLPVRSQGGVENPVYVASHGWHTGFIIPAGPLRKSIPELGRRFGGSGYIEIGWGDRGFYQAEKITADLAIRAIFWPTESVVHAVAVPTDPVAFFPNSELEELRLGEEELSSLLEFISGSLYRDGGGDIMPLGKGLYGDSQFYRGVGDYHLMNTCNKWTAKGLMSAGMDISPTFKLTAGSIMGCMGDYPPRKRGPARAIGAKR